MCLCPFSQFLLSSHSVEMQLIFNPTKLKKKKTLQNPSWSYSLNTFLGAYSGSEGYMVYSSMSFPVHMKDWQRQNLIDWRTKAMKTVSWIPIIWMAEIIYFYTITYLDDPTLSISRKSKSTRSSRKGKTKQEQTNLYLFWKLNVLFFQS